MIDTNNLGKKIASVRKKAKLTQSDLASCVGVTAQAISKWERGNACPDIAILDEIEFILLVSVQRIGEFRLVTLDDMEAVLLGKLRNFSKYLVHTANIHNFRKVVLF